MGPHGWRDRLRSWFRPRCEAIASYDATSEGLFIVLCGRRRFHRGSCATETSSDE